MPFLAEAVQPAGGIISDDGIWAAETYFFSSNFHPMRLLPATYVSF